MSGLSTPNRSIDSCHVMRRNAGARSPRTDSTAVCTASVTTAITSSASAKLISMSYCMNSNWRSARGSSSRRHRAIWKYRSKPPTISSCLNSCGLCGKA